MFRPAKKYSEPLIYAHIARHLQIFLLRFEYGFLQLAHEAYKVAQSLDPNYVSCWIGQVSTGSN